MLFTQRWTDYFYTPRLAFHLTHSNVLSQDPDLTTDFAWYLAGWGCYAEINNTCCFRWIKLARFLAWFKWIEITPAYVGCKLFYLALKVSVYVLYYVSIMADVLRYGSWAEGLALFGLSEQVLELHHYPHSLVCPRGTIQCVAGRKPQWNSAFRAPVECTPLDLSQLAGTLQLHQDSERYTFPAPLKPLFIGVSYLNTPVSRQVITLLLILLENRRFTQRSGQCHYSSSKGEMVLQLYGQNCISFFQRVSLLLLW